MEAKELFNKEYPREDCSNEWVQEYDKWRNDMIGFAEQYAASKMPSQDQIEIAMQKIHSKDPSLLEAKCEGFMEGLSYLEFYLGLTKQEGEENCKCKKDEICHICRKENQ